MPNVEAIRAWVADLRTTDVPQGQQTLRSTKGDCCLGRACEVYRIATGRGKWEGDEDGFFFEDGIGNRESGVMPRGVAEWFGVMSDPRLRKGRDMLVQASELNDIDALTFTQIADAVERTFPAGES